MLPAGKPGGFGFLEKGSVPALCSGETYSAFLCSSYVERKTSDQPFTQVCSGLGMERYLPHTLHRVA